MAQHLFARFLEVHLEVRDSVPKDSGKQHPLEVVRVQTVYLRLERVGQLRATLVPRLLLGFLPQPVVFSLSASCVPESQEGTLVGIDQLPLVERAAQLAAAPVPVGHRWGR